VLGTKVGITAVIRKAKRNDAQDVLHIRNAAIRSRCADFYSVEQLSKWTKGDLTEQFAEAVENYCYVAISGELVVATGMINLESGKIDALFVEPTHMSTGLGKEMLFHLEKLAHEVGLTQLSLNSTLNAAPFYRAHGFVGDSIATYESPRGVSLACVPMVKALSSGA
jgi:N-acetylglutamate synthase-like GNAT family acetyltransferase